MTLPPGIATCSDLSGRSSLLYVATHLSRIAALRITKAGTSERGFPARIEAIPNPTLQMKLLSVQEIKDRSRNWGGLSVVKTWGLASLPNNGIVGACISVHPGDAPQYLMPSEERSTIIFTSDKEEESFPWQKDWEVKDACVTQETVLEATFSYQRTQGLTPSTFSDRITKAAIAARQLLNNHNITDEQDHLVESCPFCSQDIPFESLVEACCSGGHQFSKSYHNASIMSP